MTQGPLDEDTKVVLGAAAWCLQRFFGYTDEAAAAAAVEEYRERWKNRHDDWFYHHEGPFLIAARLYFCRDLNGEESKFVDWRIKQGWTCEPREATEYFFERLAERQRQIDNPKTLPNC
jgi:hypothetical protein